MKAWLPAPLLSLALFAVWLLLANTLEPAQVVLAALLAVIVPRFTERLRPEVPVLKKPATIVRLGLTVLGDIVRSNIDVARRILGPERAIAPRFIWVPLDIRDPHGILALAGVISMTPGTLTADVTPDRRYLLVHAFHIDAGGEAALIAQIKLRYEQPLREIFD